MASKARAYAQQARADYDAYVASGEADEPVLGEHHRLHLLQMALEKLAKAFLYHAEPGRSLFAPRRAVGDQSAPRACRRRGGGNEA